MTEVEPIVFGARAAAEVKKHTNGDASGVVALLQRGDHVEIGERLVAKLREQAAIVHSDGKLYQYTPRGVFEPVPRARQSRIVQGFAGARVAAAEGATKPLRLKAHDVAGAIRLAHDQVSEPDYFAVATRGIAFGGGFVEVTAEHIIERPHSPEHHARFAYEFGFVRDARPSAFMRFFRDVFAADADADAKIDLVQEYLGVSLLGLATMYQRALVLLGDGANGKGVLTTIAEQCMPAGSVCAIPPQDAGQEYRRAQLAGKLLNVVSELPESDILDSESWKAVVAGDTMTGREIRQAPFTFRPVAGHIYAANRLPGTTDQTHGFWRRLLVVPFNRIFDQHEQNPGLAAHILETERPAIVGWMLAGAQRALQQGALTMPASSRTALDRWRQLADQVRAFVDERCERLPLDAAKHTWTAATELYRTYRGWAGDNGHRPIAANNFGERMRMLGLGSESDGAMRRYPVRLGHAD